MQYPNQKKEQNSHNTQHIDGIFIFEWLWFSLRELRITRDDFTNKGENHIDHLNEVRRREYVLKVQCGY